MFNVTKMTFPDIVQEHVEKIVTILTNEGLFDKSLSFPPDTKEIGKIHLWNYTGNVLLSKFIEGSEDFLLSVEEMQKIISDTIIQTNLDSLMKDELIDGIENEDGEMIYWVTDKGKGIVKEI